MEIINNTAPAGPYLQQIVKAETKPTRKGDSLMLNIQFEFQSGTRQYRKWWWRKWTGYHERMWHRTRDDLISLFEAAEMPFRDTREDMEAFRQLSHADTLAECWARLPYLESKLIGTKLIALEPKESDYAYAAKSGKTAVYWRQDVAEAGFYHPNLHASMTAAHEALPKVGYDTPAPAPQTAPYAPPAASYTPPEGAGPTPAPPAEPQTDNPFHQDSGDIPF